VEHYIVTEDSQFDGLVRNEEDEGPDRFEVLSGWGEGRENRSEEKLSLWKIDAETIYAE
jgi:hypothetical protein